MSWMWWPVGEIVQAYAVSERTLAAYSRRGDLGRRFTDGVPHYPAEVVHELFPRRGCASLDDRTGDTMGTVGVTALGQATPEAADVKLLSQPPRPSTPAEVLCAVNAD